MDKQYQLEEKLLTLSEELKLKLNLYKSRNSSERKNCETQTLHSYLEDSKHMVVLVTKVRELEDELFSNQMEVDFYKDSSDHFNRLLEIEKKKTRQIASALATEKARNIDLSRELSEMKEQMDFIELEASLAMADLRESADLNCQTLSTQIVDLNAKLIKLTDDVNKSEVLLKETNTYIESLEDELTSARKLPDKFSKDYLEYLDVCEALVLRNGTKFSDGKPPLSSSENTPLSSIENLDPSEPPPSLQFCKTLAGELIRYRTRFYRENSNLADSKIEDLKLKLWSAEAHTNNIRNILSEYNNDIPNSILEKLKVELVDLHY